MKQDKWTQQLHDKLAEYETAAPEGLWDDIESALTQQTDTRHARFITMRRWAVAASLAALLLGGSYWRWAQEPTQSEIIEDMEARETATTEAGDTRLASALEPFSRHRTSVPPRHHTSISPITPERAETMPPTEPNLPQPDATAQEEMPQSDTLRGNRNQHDHGDRSPDFVSKLTNQESRSGGQRRAVSPRHRATIGLYASNGFGTQDNSNRVVMSENMAANYNYTASISDRYHSARSRAPSYLAGIEEREKHYQPVSFGLTVSYPLGNRLFVTTGAVYTKLRSDFTNLVYGQVTNNQQTLHYIGVPLAVGYQLWNHKGLRVYATAGIQADWNVQADLKTVVGTQSISKDACQWSVNGSLGLQYDLLPQVGLYAEPGVKHYIDNGSRVDNFFKDKPTNFNLQVGLRMNLGR